MAQNPQTQAYELRLGYFRTQFYRVPTSTNSIYAPSVVSSIDVKAGFPSTISEKFAAGESCQVPDGAACQVRLTRSRIASTPFWRALGP